MSSRLKVSTAITLAIGPFVDPATPETEEEALTLSQADIRLSKNGGSFAQKNDTNSATHMENGFYSCALNTTDTNTLGRLIVAVDEAGALIWWQEFEVVTAEAWDADFSTGNRVVTLAAGAVSSTAIANDAITAAKIASDAIAEIADGVWDEDIDAAHQTANTAGKRLDDASSTVATNLNATVSSRSAFNAGSDTVNLSTTSEGQIDAIESRVTTALPNSGPGASGGLPLYDDLFSVVAEGTLATVTNAGQMTLSAGFNANDDFYNGMFLVPQDGPAAHQPRAISDYVGSSKTCTFTGTGSQLSRPFSVAPEAGDSVKILGLSGTI